MTNSTRQCTRCGRTLHSADSIARGYGRTCQRKIREAAALVTCKPAALAKAQELIADGGIIPVKTKRIRVFAVISSNGTSHYLTAPQACNCAAGLRGHAVCYHRVAAQLIAA